MLSLDANDDEYLSLVVGEHGVRARALIDVDTMRLLFFFIFNEQQPKSECALANVEPTQSPTRARAHIL